MSATQRSAYDVLSAANKDLVDTDIAVRFNGAKVSDNVSLGRLRERGAEDIESLLRNKKSIIQEARQLGIKPTRPTESFPPALANQILSRSR